MSRPTAVGVDLRALVGRPTGIGHYTLELLEELAALNRYRLVGMAHAPVSTRERLDRAGVELEVQRAPLGVLWQQALVPRRLARGDIDVFWSPVITLPARLDRPGVITVHDLIPLLYPETQRLKVRLIFAGLLRRSIEIAHTVVADSRATADDLVEQFPAARGKLAVVYPGVADRFRPASAEEVEAIRTDLDLPEGYVLFVGTLEPRKNLDRLLDAWERLRRENHSTPPLVVVGGYGWKSRRLTRRLEALGPAGLRHVDGAGLEELVRYYQGARLLALPSLYEGFGLPAAEAMACGVPTVVGAASSLPEVVGDAGLQVDPDDTLGLASAMRKILTDSVLTHELVGRGIERSRRFDWPRAAAEIGEILDQAAAGSPPARAAGRS